MSPVTVLFDARCPSCRLLASVLAEDSPAHWRYIAWQDFARGSEPGPASMLRSPSWPSELCVRADGSWLEGELAWQYLVSAEPRLQMWQKIASKIGIAPPLSARWLRRIGHGIRRFCGKCPHA